MFILPNNATIIEVGPRDGLQNESKYVNEEDKLGLLRHYKGQILKKWS